MSLSLTTSAAFFTWQVYIPNSAFLYSTPLLTSKETATTSSFTLTVGANYCKQQKSKRHSSTANAKTGFISMLV